MTVDLEEALFLDFVVEVALIWWLWSVLDDFGADVSPLSMACKKSIRKESIITVESEGCFLFKVLDISLDIA